MINNDTALWGPYDELGRMIAQKPYQSPPVGIAPRIMEKIEPKRPGWGARIRMHLFEPFTVSLTPLTAAAVALCLVLGGAFLSNRMVSETVAPAGVQSASGNVPVMFRFKSSEAFSVAVIGTFNRWNPKGYEMVQDAETGTWSLRVNIAPGKYDYVFLVNGEALATDPHADAMRSDGYGHRNSVLFVKGENGQNI